MLAHFLVCFTTTAQNLLASARSIDLATVWTFQQDYITDMVNIK